MKKKEKELKAQKKLNIVGPITLAVIFSFAVYIFIKMKTIGLGASALSFMLRDSIILVFMISLSLLILYLSQQKFKLDKAEKDVDKIRDDLIERSTEIWRTNEEAKKRYAVYKFLKEKKDINLFHK